MPAQVVYVWDYIDPSATVGVNVYGYPTNWASVFSAVVSPLEGQAYTPLGQINLTQEEVTADSDGTMMRTAFVQNLAPFNPCSVQLATLYDTF